MKRACTKEQCEQRRMEIINIVNTMFDTMDYQEITMKSISERISIARSSLYCYYQSKEEIMLDCLKNEYLVWINELIACFNKQYLSKELLAKEITNTYINHMRLLKIVSIYLTDIEMHCSFEKLKEFKLTFVNLFPLLESSIHNQFKYAKSEDLDILFSTLLMLTHSLYPMVKPNENQYNAMKAVGMKINEDAYKYCYDYISFILRKL